MTKQLTLVAVVAGLALAIGGGGFALQANGPDPAPAPSPVPSDAPVPDPTPITEAGKWRAAVLSDYQPINAVIVNLVQTLEGWRNGTATAEAARASVELSLPKVRETRAALAKRRPLPQAPRALRDYHAAASLYLESLELARVATTLPKGDLLAQLQRASTRVRTLGDRMFDLAGAELEPFDPRGRDSEDVVVRKPAEVPDWEAINLGAGPPLDVPPSPAAPRAYERVRPQYGASAWSAAISGLGIPSGPAEAHALASGSTVELRDLSRALVAASDAVHALPDPQGKRIESTRVQLALLIHAEAARVAQLATLGPVASRSALRESTHFVAAIGDAQWTNLLPPRTTGFAARP